MRYREVKTRIYSYLVLVQDPSKDRRRVEVWDAIALDFDGIQHSTALGLTAQSMYSLEPSRLTYGIESAEKKLHHNDGTYEGCSPQVPNARQHIS